MENRNVLCRTEVKLLLAISPLIVTAAPAQTAGESEPTTELWRRGNAVHGAYVERYFSQDADRHISIAQLNTEAGYFVLDRLAVATNAYVMRASGHRVKDFRNLDVSAFGAGFAGFLRLEALQLEHFGVFADVGAGMVFTTQDFPPEGTPWNFAQRYGGGLNIRLNGRSDLIVAWRYMHISNGKGLGHPQNPAYDGDGLVAGLRFAWGSA